MEAFALLDEKRAFFRLVPCQAMQDTVRFDFFFQARPMRAHFLQVLKVKTRQARQDTRVTPGWAGATREMLDGA